MSDLVLTETDGHVLIVSLNSPERHNAMSRAMYGMLLEVVRSAAADHQIRAIVLRGEGKSFCSGIDTSDIGNREPDESDFSYGRTNQELNLLLYDTPKPVIVCLKGHTLGKGLEVALAGDMRLVAQDTQLGLPEVTMGLVTDNGGAPRLTALVGPARAKYLIMSGELIGADQAVTWGLAEWLVTGDEIDHRAVEIARVLAARSPLAVAMAKELVNQVDRGAVLNGTRSEMLAQIALMGTADHDEARSALRERRPPEFHSC